MQVRRAEIEVHHDDCDSRPFPRLPDFMAALSDPGGFSKGAEKQAETMKGLGIEQTDSKAEAKKKKEEEAKKGIHTLLSKSHSRR